MTLDQLRYLVLLADERHFTRAAERANVAQPALSRQIRKLEGELGVALVDRTTRRVALTGAGQRLVERARRILAELELARRELSRTADLLDGRVVIGVTPTPGPVDAAPLLADFHRRHPAVEVALREELSIVLVEQLRRDEIDLAFVTRVAPAAHARLTLVPLATERLVAIVPVGHPLGRRETISLRDLRDEAFVGFPPGATIRDTVERAAKAAGFTPRIAFESNDVGRLRSFVAHGLGVGVVPVSDSAGLDAVAVDLEGADLVHEVCLAWRATRQLNPAAARLLADVRATFAAAGS